MTRTGVMALAVSGASLARAHDTWLLPARFQLRAGATVDAHADWQSLFTTLTVSVRPRP